MNNSSFFANVFVRCCYLQVYVLLHNFAQNKNLYLMKAYNLFVALSFLALLFSGCRNSTSKSIAAFQSASGLPFETLLVVDEKFSDSPLVDSLKMKLTEAYPSLPQAEPTTKLMVCSAKDFTGLMRYVRNIVILDINPSIYTKASIVKKDDVWAKRQLVVNLQSPTLEELEKRIYGKPNVVLQEIVKEERLRYASFLKDNHSFWVDSLVNSSFGIRLCAPEDMSAFRKGDDFIWVSNDAPTGRMDMLVYRLKSLKENGAIDIKDKLVSLRDSVLKINLPGAFPGSYMQTEKKFFPVNIDKSKIDGRDCFVMRGLWKMHGDKMGGPFVAYFNKDEIKGDYIVVEGFVYSPESKKKVYMHILESSINTVKLDI